MGNCLLLGYNLSMKFENFESLPDITEFPAATESLLNLESNASFWPESVKTNEEILAQVRDRKDCLELSKVKS